VTLTGTIVLFIRLSGLVYPKNLRVPVGGVSSFVSPSSLYPEIFTNGR